MTECSCCSPEETMLWQTSTELQLSSCDTRYPLQAAGRAGEVAWRVRRSGWHGAMQSRTCLPIYLGSARRILAFAKSLLTPSESTRRRGQLLHLNQQLWPCSHAQRLFQQHRARAVHRQCSPCALLLVNTGQPVLPPGMGCLRHL